MNIMFNVFYYLFFVKRVNILKIELLNFCARYFKYKAKDTDNFKLFFLWNFKDGIILYMYKN